MQRSPGLDCVHIYIYGCFPLNTDALFHILAQNSVKHLDQNVEKPWQLAFSYNQLVLSQGASPVKPFWL